ARVPISEGIGADDPLTIENNQVAPAKLLKQRPNGRLAQPYTLCNRAWRRGSSVFGVNLEQPDANAIRGGVIAAPAIEHMIGSDHGLQGISDHGDVTTDQSGNVTPGRTV